MHSRKIDELVPFLQQFQFLQPLGLSTIKHLADIMHYRRYLPNQVIFSQGDLSDGIYFILKGECKILRSITIPTTTTTSKRNKNNSNKSNTDNHTSENIVMREQLVPVATLVANQYFGEISLFLNSTRTATVISLTEVDVYVISKIEFIQKMTAGNTLKLFKEQVRIHLHDLFLFLFVYPLLLLLWLIIIIIIYLSTYLYRRRRTIQQIKKFNKCTKNKEKRPNGTNTKRSFWYKL